MRSSAVLSAFLLVSMVAASPVSVKSKADIYGAYEEDKKKLKTALDGADGSVLVAPLRILGELKNAGRRDQDDIVAFGCSEALSEQHKSSVNFWKKKMDEAIEPYVSDPQRYKGLIIDYFSRPSDPTGNDSQEYKEAECKINDMVNKGLYEIKTRYKEQLKKTKAKKAEDVTASSWARLRLDRLLEEADDYMRNGAQWAKREAAGGKADFAVEKVKQDVQERIAEFKKETCKVTKEYQDSTNI